MTVSVEGGLGFSAPESLSALESRSALPVRREAWDRFGHRRSAVVGLCLLATLAVVALAAPLLVRLGILADPSHLDIANANTGLGSGHVLGTDSLGRDLLSRAVYGARISLSVGVLVQLAVLVFGGAVGLIAGCARGWLDNVLMRVTDAAYAVPALLIVLVAAAMFGPGYWHLVVAISVASWMGMARIVRGQVLAVRARGHVEAARAAGARGLGLLRRHVIPDCLPAVVVLVTFGVPAAILAEAFLSFISVGMRPPAPSWGVMLAEGYRSVFAYPLQVVVPALALCLATLGFTLVANGLRDAFDPRTSLWR